MSAVNPLVVMDRYAADFRPNQGFDGEDMRQARELVSNLLDAIHEFQVAILGLIAASDSDDETLHLTAAAIYQGALSNLSKAREPFGDQP